MRYHLDIFSNYTIPITACPSNCNCANSTACAAGECASTHMLNGASCTACASNCNNCTVAAQCSPGGCVSGYYLNGNTCSG